MSIGQDHREWHRIAASEGVNPWDCPFDCMDPDWDEDNPGPILYATIWRPSVNRRTGGYDMDRNNDFGYPVFSRDQMRLYARSAAERIGVDVRVVINHAV